jgi:uncharacterized membrane protein YhhN
MMPFPGGIEATANGTLFFSAMSALVYCMMLDAPPAIRRTGVKTAAVALLALLAFQQGGPFLLVGALALSAVGDAFLSRDGDKAFLGGLCAFLAGHLLYIVLFVVSGSTIAAFLSSPLRIAGALAMGVFAFGMLKTLWPRVDAGLRLPIAVYVLAILAMGVTSLTLDYSWAIVGAVLFMASDALLATEKFLLSAGSPRGVWMRYAVWVLYYAGQALITLGFLLGR